MNLIVRIVLAIAVSIAWLYGLLAFVSERGPDPRANWEQARDMVGRTAAPLFPKAVEVRVIAGQPIRFLHIPTIDGGALTGPEVVLLRRSVFYAPPRHAFFLCCIPHHSFVFYGPGRRPLGVLEVCFQCLCGSVYPSEVPGSPKRSVDWDEEALKAIVLAHHLPLKDEMPSRRQ
ncbi:MAG: hypothetical protein JO261_01460 [Alphaproteobacteria bacterium]|nr:hypothetical protein [Alphaproteobacteria bacterium]MBV9692344.1 hypothetical protein [Alphaproteobacteria bacterium]